MTTANVKIEAAIRHGSSLADLQKRFHLTAIQCNLALAQFTICQAVIVQGMTDSQCKAEMNSIEIARALRTKGGSKGGKTSRSPLYRNTTPYQNARIAEWYNHGLSMATIAMKIKHDPLFQGHICNRRIVSMILRRNPHLLTRKIPSYQKRQAPPPRAPEPIEEKALPRTAPVAAQAASPLDEPELGICIVCKADLVKKYPRVSYAKDMRVCFDDEDCTRKAGFGYAMRQTPREEIGLGSSLGEKQGSF